MPVIRLAVLLALCMACLGTTALGQAEGPQRYFNVKAGPVYVILTAGVSTEYTDNVNLSNGKTTPIQPELTIYPNLGITAATQLQFLPLSETNSNDLRLTANLGFREYVFHPELNQQVMDINIAPDSELSFIIHAGHFKIRLHDGFSMQSDPTTDGSLSNVAQFRRFVNSIGADAQWNVNSKTKVDFGYTHSSLYALSITTLGNTSTTAATKNLTTSRLNSTTDSAHLSANCQVLSLLNIGFSASAQATSFPGAPEQDSTAFSYGPTAALRLTQYTSLIASSGITRTQSGNVFTGTGGAGSMGIDSSTNYYDLTLSNRLNTYYTHNLSIGRQVALSLLGLQTQVQYVRYNSTWRVNSHISISTGLFAEDTTNAGMIFGSFHYRQYGCMLNTSYRLSRKMSTTLGYRFIEKVADDPAQNYKQNTITWAVNYQF
ncbi:MAG: hypothetical protein NTZ46_03785 [Verrucomicrobia bacterium]|nr:hypothetical protein [Verrucomicrobiota bacterium]